jgi:hypothetical protein
MDTGAAQAVLMYFILPVWVLAGFADYLCHRAAADFCSVNAPLTAAASRV